MKRKGKAKAKAKPRFKKDGTQIVDQQLNRDVATVLMGILYAASMARQQQMAAASPLLRGNAATLSKTLDHVLQTKQQVRTRRV